MDGRQKKEVEDMIGIPFPSESGIPDIIQSYLCDETLALDEKLVSLSRLSFFGDNEILYASRAAYYALWGRPDKFEEIVAYCPEALSKTVKITGPHGDVITATPYQCLLREDDHYIKDEKDRTFLQMACSYLSGQNARGQEENWFNEWDEKAHVVKLKVAFDEVLTAFDESKAMTEKSLQADCTLQTAIKNFKEDLKELTVEAKKNCIPQLWDYSAQFCTSERYKDYGDDGPKNKLFSFLIYGGIEDNLPPWGLQMLYYAATGAVVQRIDVSSYYSTLTKNSSELRLGVNSSMRIGGGGMSRQLRLEVVAELFSEFMSKQKNSSKTQSYAATESSPKSRLIL